jgi:hypothetical protein
MAIGFALSCCEFNLYIAIADQISYPLPSPILPFSPFPLLKCS